MEKELTILIPCLNEEQTIGICISKAKKFVEMNAIDAEILIVDNGSTDHSVEIAKKLEVRVIRIDEKGYGNVLRLGTRYAKGKFVIMGDADDSYNFLELMPILEKLRNKFDLVVGNRYKGKLEKGSMKILHKYIGTPVISYIAKMKYKIKEINDFNCGLRGYVNKEIIRLECKSEGMEYASEMIIKAKQKGLKIVEIPINFYKDGRNKKSHLNPIKDALRHIQVII